MVNTRNLLFTMLALDRRAQPQTFQYDDQSIRFLQHIQILVTQRRDDLRGKLQRLLKIFHVDLNCIVIGQLCARGYVGFDLFCGGLDALPYLRLELLDMLGLDQIGLEEGAGVLDQVNVGRGGVEISRVVTLDLRVQKGVLR